MLWIPKKKENMKINHYKLYFLPSEKQQCDWSVLSENSPTFTWLVGLVRLDSKGGIITGQLLCPIIACPLCFLRCYFRTAIIGISNRLRELSTDWKLLYHLRSQPIKSKLSSSKNVGPTAKNVKTIFFSPFWHFFSNGSHFFNSACRHAKFPVLV